LKKTDFSFHGSGDNKYIALQDHSTKNHRGDSKDDKESQGGRLYVMPSNPMCPGKVMVVARRLRIVYSLLRFNCLDKFFILSPKVFFP
jgi:hypothetical protein